MTEIEKEKEGKRKRSTREVLLGAVTNAINRCQQDSRTGYSSLIILESAVASVLNRVGKRMTAAFDSFYNYTTSVQDTFDIATLTYTTPVKQERKGKKLKSDESKAEKEPIEDFTITIVQNRVDGTLSYQFNGEDFDVSIFLDHLHFDVEEKIEKIIEKQTNVDYQAENNADMVREHALAEVRNQIFEWIARIYRGHYMFQSMSLMEGTLAPKML